MSEPKHFSELAPAPEQYVEHQKTRRKQYRAPYARFKLAMIFIDTGAPGAPYYSYDYYYQYSKGTKTRILDEEQGLLKLWKYLNKKLEADAFVSAVIFVTLATNTDTTKKHYDYPLITCSRNGKPKAKLPLQFLRKKYSVTEPMKARIETILDIELIRKYIAENS